MASKMYAIMVARYSATDSEDRFISRMFFPEANFSTFSTDIFETLPHGVTLSAIEAML